MKQELAWALKPFPPLIAESKRASPSAQLEYLQYAVDAVKAGTKYGDFYDWAIAEGLGKDHRFFGKLIQAFKSARYDHNGQSASVLSCVVERLEQGASGMRPYKPKMGPHRLKTDPEHRMDREARKHRTGSDKMKATKLHKMYYKKNKNQLLQRNKRSRMLHKKPDATISSAMIAVYARLA